LAAKPTKLLIGVPLQVSEILQKLKVFYKIASAKTSRASSEFEHIQDVVRLIDESVRTNVNRFSPRKDEN